jgi:outer membrane lipoprotein-sorting protein
MQKRRATVGAAATAAAASVAGLVVLATPASAGPAPSLPEISPQQLVASVMRADMPAMKGTVAVQNNLGLPAVPGMPALAVGRSTARVFTDGHNRARVSLPTDEGATTIVEDGDTLWRYDSEKHKATKTPLGPAAGHHEPPASANPTAEAKQLVGYVRQYSTVTVDGTARVAGRPAYELVLTPKPTEHTKVRAVRVAVDAQTRIPLRFEMFANGTTTPALAVGFSAVHMGPQDPSLFAFTPPEGTKVVRVPLHRDEIRGAVQAAQPTTVGTGWDTVLLTSTPPAAQQGRGGQDGAKLLSRLGKPASGPWGSGREITTAVGSALVTSDGHVAVGLVPPQVLEQAVEGHS